LKNICPPPLWKIVVLIIWIIFPSTVFAAWQYQESSPNNHTLRAIWGSSATDVFVVGDDGDAWSFELYSIASSTSPSAGKLRSVWGVAANDVFAVGDSGKLYHFDGADWGIMNSDTDHSLNAIWSASADDIYIVGQNGAMLHYWPEIVAPPQLVITKNGYFVTFSWTPVANASGYFFWFDMVGPGSGFDGAFDYIFDMHTTRELSAELWPGATFYVCVQGHDRNTLGYPSTIEYLHTP